MYRESEAMPTWELCCSSARAAVLSLIIWNSEELQAVNGNAQFPRVG